ncbi:Leukotriene B4 receptor 2 [Anabarilius grahami]|uniref:Leukotriene B4 receptor 2 n=1 Tax=Anabarilius grahami TaxID=495550 RepID=A0A3N0Y488_ANAGA|nr:Leukotriene B4 receptor 2 [Anabarilius grahami]
MSIHLLFNTTNSVTNNVTDIAVSTGAGRIIGALILCLFLPIGISGNLLIIWSILTRTRHRSITTLLILNLACADGFLMFLLPFFIVYLVKHSWIFTLPLCKILLYLCSTNMYASIFLITLMSLHRMVVVVWRKHAGVLRDRRALIRVLVGLWILALCVSVPNSVFWTTFRSEQEPKTVACACKHSQPRDVILQHCLEILVGFLMPYGLIIGSYVCVLRRIRKTRFRRHIRSEKLILVIVITFGLTWLPFHIINMVEVAGAFLPEDSPAKARLSQIWISFRGFTSTFTFISSSINPVLYTFAGKSYIKREGLAFMARLFESSGIESTRKIRQSQSNQEQEKKEEVDHLKDGI